MRNVTINLLIFTACLYGQTADKSLTFEAASVKSAALPTPDGRGMIRLEGRAGAPARKIRAGFTIRT